MWRRLLLVRHAKSAWDDPSLGDHDRPLAPRGVNALPRLRDHLVTSGHRPDVVLCSSARRTVDTLSGIRAALADGALVEVDEEWYLADAPTVLARLRAIDREVGCVLVVGHNPTIQDLALALGGAGDESTRGQLALKLPTGAAVTLSFDGEWGDLGSGVATVDDLFMPRRPRP